MTKSDADLGVIDTDRARSDLREPTWLGNKSITAFDLETADGAPFVLSVSDGRVDDTHSLAERGKPLDPRSVWNHLSSRRYRDTLNVWYNLSFDAEVVLSALDRDALEELHATCSATATVGSTEYDVMYIPGKMLRIDTTSDGRNAVTHYDVSGFFRCPLDDAAAEWLGERKLDGEGANVERFDDAEYRREHIREIREYAEVDADLTRRVARAFADTAEGEVGVPFGRPVSTGYLAAEFFRARASSKPGWGLNAAQSLAWDAYAGGRFEVFERGDVGRVAGPDINSAYPAVLAELPDPGTLAWRIVEEPELDDVRDADYAFVRGKWWTDHTRRIQPFPLKRDGVVTFPALDGHVTTVTHPEIEVALDDGVLLDAEPQKAALGYVTDATEYPFGFFSDLYEKRKAWERDGRDFAAVVLKIVMNSLYGKTAQTTARRDMPGEGVRPSELTDREKLRSVFGRACVERLDAGELFNPMLAAMTTAETRAELHRAVVEHDLVDDTVLFATDCIMVDEQAFDASGFDTRLGDTLGEWDFDYRGEAFVVGSGVYEVVDDDDELIKRSTRGFREADLGDGLKEAAREADTSDIPIRQDRPTTLGEALTRSNLSLAEVGKFRTAERGLSAEFDRKRDWPPTHFGELVDTRQVGDPIRLKEVERREAEREFAEASARRKRERMNRSLDETFADARAEVDDTLSASVNKREAWRRRIPSDGE